MNQSKGDRIPDDVFKAACEQHENENREKFSALLESCSKEQILRDLAPGIAHLLDAPHRRGFCPNPAHKQKSGKAFRFYPDFDSKGCCVCNTCGTQKGIVQTLMFVNGWSMPETMKALNQFFGIAFDIKRVFEICGRTYTGNKGETPEAVAQPREYKPCVTIIKADYSQVREKLKNKQKNLLTADDPRAAQIIKNYLSSRGIPAEAGARILGRSSFVSLEEKYFYFDDSKTWQLHGTYPAIFQLIISPEGHAASFHRHYLNPEGKGKATLAPKGNAELPTKKGMEYCAEPKGCYMPVGAGPSFSGAVIGVGEGMETTLSGAILSGLPSRAASAGMLRFIDIPESARTVVHFCDPDTAGLTEGDALKARCAERGIKYIREIPPAVPGRKSSDWNDVLKHYGVERARSFMSYPASLLKRCS